jgi:hypothetical protein
MNKRVKHNTMQNYVVISLRLDSQERRKDRSLINVVTAGTGSDAMLQVAALCPKDDIIAAYSPAELRLMADKVEKLTPAEISLLNASIEKAEATA